MTRRARLAVLAAAALAVAAVGCDADPTQLKTGEVVTTPPPTVTIPSWVAANCYVWGYDANQCMDYAHSLGY